MSLCSPVMLPVASSFQQFRTISGWFSSAAVRSPASQLRGGVMWLVKGQVSCFKPFSVCILTELLTPSRCCSLGGQTTSSADVSSMPDKGRSHFLSCFSLVVWFCYASLIGQWGSWRLESGQWADELKSSVTSLSEASASAAGLRARWEKVTESQNDLNTNICSW